MKKKILSRILITILLLAVAASFIPYALSLGVMKVYSAMHEKESLMTEKGFSISIPGGISTSEKDWYPFVMVYHPGKSFGRWAGKPGMELTILYNFPAFHYGIGRGNGTGCSMLFDPESPYYSSFYGAYIISGAGENSSIADLAAKSAQYDMQTLVLADFGIQQSDMVFQWTQTGQEDNADYAGSGGWLRTDALLNVNGLAHIPQGFRRSYIQYGLPNYDVGANEQLQPVQLFGRVYGKYFEEYESFIFFYILTADSEVLEQCDRKILSQSVIYDAKDNHAS